MIRILRAGLLAALLPSCADYALEAKESGEGAPAEDEDGGNVVDTGVVSDSGLDDAYVPDGWVLRAALAVAGGAPVADGAALELELVDTTAGAVACFVSLDPTGLVAGTPPEDAEGAVWAWWETPVVPQAEACGALPEELGIGIGELHPAVRAELGAVGHDDVADALYGAYLRADGGTLYVFGYAGTDADFEGDDAAAAPPPDGTYTVAPLYVLPLP